MNGQSNYVLSLLQRSQQISVHIYDIQGQLICSVARALGQAMDGDEPYLEPDEVLRGAITLIESALRKAGVTAFDLAAIGLCVSCHGLVFWNGVSGAPLFARDTPANWPQLSAVCAAEFMRECVNEAMGQVDAPSDPRQLRAGGVDSWLLWNLTQGESMCIDVGHDLALYWDAAEQSYEETWLQGSGFTQGMIAQVANQGGVLARVNTIYLDHARVPVSSLSYVQTAAIIGAILQPAGEAFITYDREGSVAVRMAEPRKSLGAAGGLGYRRIAGYASHTPAWSLFGRFSTPQNVAAWLDAKFDLTGALPEVASLMASNEPLVVASDAWFKGKACIIGVGPETTPAAIYAAALRAMAFTVADLIDEAERIIGKPIMALYADELAYGIPTLFSFQAGVSGKPMFVRTGDSSALGAALLAGIGVGLWTQAHALTLLQEQFSTRRYDIPVLGEEVREQRAMWRRAMQTVATG